MKKITQADSITIAEKFLMKLKAAIKEAQAEIVIEYFELEIDDLRFERCFCAYLQTSDQTEAIIFETTLGRFFYLKTETFEAGAAVKKIPNLYLLDSGVSNAIPKRIRDKMQAVIMDRVSRAVELEDFSVKFRLIKP